MGIHARPAARHAFIPSSPGKSCYWLWSERLVRHLSHTCVRLSPTNGAIEMSID